MPDRLTRARSPLILLHHDTQAAEQASKARAARIDALSARPAPPPESYLPPPCEEMLKGEERLKQLRAMDQENQEAYLPALRALLGIKPAKEREPTHVGDLKIREPIPRRSEGSW